MKDELSPCVHCGFCLPTCASYLALGTEMDSPRGRIHFLKAIKEGEAEWDATSASHFDTCLGCFACVSACPSGVRYDELIEEIRPVLHEKSYRSPKEAFIRKILLMLLPYPDRLKSLLRPFRLYPDSKLRRQVGDMGILRLLGESLETMESLLPRNSLSLMDADLAGVYEHQGRFRGRVGLVLGCVQQVFGQQVNIAAINVLTANGYTVVVPASQGCCGAVTHHQGAVKETEEFARRMSNVFRVENLIHEFDIDEPLDGVLVAASGCGHTMKNYGSILGVRTNDVSGNQIFSGAPIFDIHEFLHKEGLSKEFKASLGPLEHPNNSEDTIRIAFHDACHMIHGQGIKMAPRKLLSYIPQVKIMETVDSGICCGSAGIYNITHPVEAKSLGRSKAINLLQTNPLIIASANIGCTLQIQRHSQSEDAVVKHPIEILNDSYSGPKNLTIS